MGIFYVRKIEWAECGIGSRRNVLSLRMRIPVDAEDIIRAKRVPIKLPDGTIIPSEVAILAKLASGDDYAYADLLAIDLELTHREHHKIPLDPAELVRHFPLAKEVTQERYPERYLDHEHKMRTQAKYELSGIEVHLRTDGQEWGLGNYSRKRPRIEPEDYSWSNYGKYIDIPVRYFGAKLPVRDVKDDRPVFLAHVRIMAPLVKNILLNVDCVAMDMIKHANECLSTNPPKTLELWMVEAMLDDIGGVQKYYTRLEDPRTGTISYLARKVVKLQPRRIRYQKRHMIVRIEPIKS